MELDWEKLIKKAYMEIYYGQSIPGAQAVGLKWYAPKHGCQTLAYFIEAVEDAITADSKPIHPGDRKEFYEEMKEALSTIVGMMEKECMAELESSPEPEDTPAGRKIRELQARLNVYREVAADCIGELEADELAEEKLKEGGGHYIFNACGAMSIEDISAALRKGEDANE